MPKINPIVLGDILVKYQTELYQIYLMSKNDEMTGRLLVLHEQMGALIAEVEKLITCEV
jgi:hypothetical protein